MTLYITAPIPTYVCVCACRAAALEEAKAQLEAQLLLQVTEASKLPDMEAQLAAEAARAALSAQQASEALQVGLGVGARMYGRTNGRWFGWEWAGMGHECMGAQMGVGLDGSGHGARMYGRMNGRWCGREWAWGTNVWAHK